MPSSGLFRYFFGNISVNLSGKKLAVNTNSSNDSCLAGACVQEVLYETKQNKTFINY